MLSSEGDEEWEMRCAQCLRRERTRSVQEMADTPSGRGRVSKGEQQGGHRSKAGFFGILLFLLKAAAA